MVFPHERSYSENQWKDLYIERNAFFKGILEGTYDKYTLIRRHHSHPSLYYSETNDHILSFIITQMKRLKYFYFDHHTQLFGPFPLNQLVTFYRLGMINKYTMIQQQASYNDSVEEMQIISDNLLLSNILSYHSKRHKYLPLSQQLNDFIKSLDYKQINRILSDDIFINDTNSMKYIFRTVSTCYSFCDLCKTESKNPIQLLLTSRIQHQDKCDKIIKILQLFTQSLQSIHYQIETKNISDIHSCRCFACCKQRCCLPAYITETREDAAKQPYEIYRVKDPMENDYDYLSLCIIPHKCTKSKYDIQIIQYLVDNDLVSLLPHHFVFAVQYHRTKILKYLFKIMNERKNIDNSMAMIHAQLWLPKQFAYFGLPRPIWLQHPTRISILGFALQPHLLDIDIIRILLENQISPNWDDLMIITSVAGNKRLQAKHKIIEYLLNFNYDKPQKHFLFYYGVYWFEMCLAINCYKTAAMISSKLIPIIMETVLDKDTHALIPKDVFGIILNFSFYPNDPGGWVDIDGDEILTKGSNLEFTDLMGYYGHSPRNWAENAKRYTIPRAFWQNEEEYMNSKASCLKIDWDNPRRPKQQKLPFAFNIGGVLSTNTTQN